MHSPHPLDPCSDRALNLPKCALQIALPRPEFSMSINQARPTRAFINLSGRIQIEQLRTRRENLCHEHEATQQEATNR
ncbi:hypothetical protein JTE90_002323 [Oedothorax gibbosus]|uniref:Uncharacterized protein n=1 Tax=Oedothorax gibbosus TaxID=931172 RepID=A0AAV6UJT0_9ARAC|nr:hypothetical protein JTE90_002323 [Oedothorax gibbosus]